MMTCIFLKKSYYICWLWKFSIFVFPDKRCFILFIFHRVTWLLLLVISLVRRNRNLFFFLMSRNHKNSSGKAKLREFSVPPPFILVVLLKRFVSRLNFLPCYAVFVSSWYSLTLVKAACFVVIEMNSNVTDLAYWFCFLTRKGVCAEKQISLCLSTNPHGSI